MLNADDIIETNKITARFGAFTFAHIFQKFCLRTVFICAQKCILSAHNFNVAFAHMFLFFFLGQLLAFFIYFII